MERDDDRGERAGMSEEERAQCLERLMARDGPLSKDDAADLRWVFDLLVREHARGVRRQLARGHLQRAEVDDLMQESFVSLYQSIVANGPPKRIRAWLWKATRRRLVNFLRDRQREPFSTGVPSSGSEPPRTPPDPGRAIDRETLPNLVRSQLSDEDWAIIEAIEVDELSYEEAAEALDIPFGTFKRHLTRARKRFAEVVQQYRGPGPKAA